VRSFQKVSAGILERKYRLDGSPEKLARLFIHDNPKSSAHPTKNAAPY
jgi:hypothetical protein